MVDARADAARVDQPAVGIVVADQKRPKPGPRAFGIGPADDHELLAVQAFVAREIEAMGVVNEVVEDGVGISRVADDGVPLAALPRGRVVTQFGRRGR